MVTLDEGGRGVGFQRILPPHPRLAAFVEHFWTQQRPVGLAQRTSWRIVPDLSPHVIAHCGPAGWSAPRVVGARSVYAEVCVADRRITVGCRLRPGALRPLFGIAASELADRSVPISELGTPNVSWELDDGSSKAAAEALCRAVGVLAGGATADARPADFIRAVRCRGIKMGTLAADLGWSERSLRRYSSEHIGMAPKLCARIARLHSLLTRALAQSSPRWSELALEADYSDHAHLIRESRELLGETPAHYWERGRP